MVTKGDMPVEFMVYIFTKIILSFKLLQLRVFLTTQSTDIYAHGWREKVIVIRYCGLQHNEFSQTWTSLLQEILQNSSLSQNSWSPGDDQ